MDEGERNRSGVMALEQKASDLFLQELLAYLIEVVPDFRADQFLERLYVRQSTLPSPGNRVPDAAISHEEIFLGLWRRKVSLVEKAAADAEALRDRLQRP